jgi:hypothetical protein
MVQFQRVSRQSYARASYHVDAIRKPCRGNSRVQWLRPRGSGLRAERGRLLRVRRGDHRDHACLTSYSVCPFPRGVRGAAASAQARRSFSKPLHSRTSRRYRKLDASLSPFKPTGRVASGRKLSRSLPFSDCLPRLAAPVSSVAADLFSSPLHG